MVEGAPGETVPDQPFFQPLRFDSPEALSIHARRALIGLCQCVGMGQKVFPVHLVVEQVETVAWLFLRLLVQLPLKHPDLHWCFQVHRQSPLLSFFRSASEVRALSSTGVTRLHRSYDPLRLPDRPSSYRCWRCDLHQCRTPPITQTTFLTCRAQYPGGPNRCVS